MAQKIKLQQLEAFLTLAEELHFGRAAAKLGVAQPALSHQIQTLENILGVVLFERTNRSVKLSSAGATLLRSSRQTLQSAHQTSLDAQRFRRGEIGNIEISYSASIAYSGVLQDVIGSYRQACPNVQMRIREMSLGDQVRALHEGRVDIGFLRPAIPNGAGISLHTLKTEKIVLLVPSSHRLAQETVVDIAECKAEPFVIPQQEPDISFHKHTLDICAAAGFTPKLGPRIRDWVTIASVVALEMGIAVAPASLDCVTLPGVAFCDIKNNTSRAEIALAYKSLNQTPVMTSFLDHILSRFA